MEECIKKDGTNISFKVAGNNTIVAAKSGCNIIHRRLFRQR